MPVGRSRQRLLVLVFLILSACEAWAATCGDGLQEELEQCEDGNTVSGDGCSSVCTCETYPCEFSVSASVHLASVVSSLAPGATIVLAGGTRYAGEGSCGWRVASVENGDSRPITIRGAAGTIVDCDSVSPVVEGAVVGTHLRLEGIHFRNAHRSGGGGGVLRTERGSRVVIEDCRFSRSSSDQEGGALLVSNSSLLIAGSHFEENTAEYGGALAIVNGARATLRDTTLTQCSAGFFGGAIYVAEAAALILNRVLLSFNDATSDGGAVGATDRCTVNVTDSIIANNTGDRGGGITVQYNSLLGISGRSRFDGNVGRSFGGAIAGIVATVEISGGPEVVFSSNTALTPSCIHFWPFGHLIARNVTFEHNFEPAIGVWPGLVELYDGVRIHDTLCTVSGCSVISNTPGSGVVATGNVTIEDNHCLGPALINTYASGGISLSEGSGGGSLGLFLSHGVTLRGNSGVDGGGLATINISPVLLNNISIRDNIAFDGSGGGAYVRGGDLEASSTIFHRNDAAVNGGGAVFESGSTGNLNSVSFSENSAGLHGGGVYMHGQDNSMKMSGSIAFLSNHAAGEGGCICVSGPASLLLEDALLSECLAMSSGGGIASRGDSSIHLSSNVVIIGCKSTQGMGGGMLAAGASLTVRVALNNDVRVENNRAQNGGGISFMCSSTFSGEGFTVMRNNVAVKDGGALYGFSSYAKLRVESDHTVFIEDNIAGKDGGGVALVQGSQFSVSAPQCDPRCDFGMLGNGVCNLECMSAACNWDGSDCNYLFLEAGSHALVPCGCLMQQYQMRGIYRCIPGNANEACFSASCNWSPYESVFSNACGEYKQALSKCPLFDGLAYQSMSSIPGLVWVKEGRGYTVAKEYVAGSGDILGEVGTIGETCLYSLSSNSSGAAAGCHVQGTGRCVNAVCSTDSPPESGHTALPIAPGESWCDTLLDWGGNIIQSSSQNYCESPGFQKGQLTGQAYSPCIDTGVKAWGVCAESPYLPSLGFDYDPDSLMRLITMPVSDLLVEQRKCGSLPLRVASNHAGRHGGGLYKDGCDRGYEEKGLCWIGGLSEQAASAMILDFSSNSAGGAGGGVFTSCLSLGKCGGVLTKQVGLPVSDGRKMLSFERNNAGGYGRNIGTAPSRLVVVEHASHYIPGKSSFDISFSMLDFIGQPVKGSQDLSIEHVVQVVVLPSNVQCEDFDTCQDFKLQMSDSYRSSGTQEVTSLIRDFEPVTFKWCETQATSVNIKIFVSGGLNLDLSSSESDVLMLQKTLTVDCDECESGWNKQIVDGLWTCTRCGKKEYVINPNLHRCQPCPAGATCEDGTFSPSNPANSVWNSTSDGIYRIEKCPAGHVLIRDEADPVLDRCVPCAADTYSVEEAVFGEHLWDRSVENYNQYCHPCPRSRAMCSGANDVRPLAGYWSPESSRLSSSDAGNTHRRQENSTTAGEANRGRGVLLYRCIPPTACLEGNATYPNGVCMPGAYGPLCGICNESDGYAKSKDGCRKCDSSGARESTFSIAAWTGVIGVPIFLTFWYFFALRPLVTHGNDEEEEEDRPEKTSPEWWNRFKARIYFSLGRASEHPIWLKMMAPVIRPAQNVISNCVAYVVKNNPKDYVKIIVSFYQVSTAFSSNIDVKWPDAVTSVWKFFAFLTMEIFKLYGYDCMFGGIDYFGRLLLVTTVPLIVVLIFTLPWIASSFYQSHRRSRVFDTCANSVMWITYLIYPLLCLMTIQGFKCIEMEGMHLLAADMKEPCPWKKSERGSGIFVWSVISMVLYPIGIPLILLACLLRLNVPRLARYGKGEANFQQLISLYIKERDEGVCSRIANYVGGHKDINQPQAGLPERAAHFFREVSSNGEHAVTCERFLTWLTFDVTDDDRDEMSQIFAHFDDDGNGALDEEEMLALLEFLIDANSRIHPDLTLRKAKSRDLKTMADHFLQQQEQERAQSIGLSRLFLKQLKQEANAVQPNPVQRRASLMHQSSFRSQGSSSRQRSSSMACSEAAADTEITQAERDKIINSLLSYGAVMMRNGVFSLPKLAWHRDGAHSDEKRVLAMIGFLLDAYHKQAWWWELFEMWRKFMLAGAIILIPTDGGKQIAFALLISTICLYTSLRTSPYITENLLKLHIMSLTAQCITLFYALLLAIQDLSSVTEVCADGSRCNQQNISDAIMESLLSLLQVSVFVLPVGLLLRDRGVFDAVWKTTGRGVDILRQQARMGLGYTAAGTTRAVQWPSDDESAPRRPRTQKKGLGQPLDTLRSSRKRACALDPRPDAPHQYGKVLDGRGPGFLRPAEANFFEPTARGADITIAVEEEAEASSTGYASASDSNISLHDLHQSLAMFSLEAKDIPAYGATGAAKRAGNRPSILWDGQAWGCKAECGFTSSVFEDVAALEKDCPVLQPFVAMGSGMDSGVSSVLHTLEDADAAGVDARQTKNSKQKYNPTPRIPRLNLRASHQSSGEVAQDTLPILDSNQGMYSPRTPRGLSQPRPRVTEPTPRLSNGEKEPNSKDRQRVALAEKIQRSENSVHLSDARVRTMERQGVVLVLARPTAISRSAPGIQQERGIEISTSTDVSTAQYCSAASLNTWPVGTWPVGDAAIGGGGDIATGNGESESDGETHFNTETEGCETADASNGGATAIGQNTRGLDLNFSQFLSELQAQPEEEMKRACFRDFISRLREERLREEMESRKQGVKTRVTFLQRVHACTVAAASDETLVENSSLCRDGEASSVTATAFLHHAVSPGPRVNVINDSSALVQSLGDAMCGNGCFGEDAHVTHWCRECDKAICSFCAQTHGRQPQTVSHALTEITSVVREREVLEEKLARVQETSVEQTRRITAEEEEIKREKQELAAQFKTEEESRQRELEQIQAAAEERAHGRKAEEERRMRALEEESTRLKANAEQEAERRKAEEDEILQQKQKLEEALARVQAHSFRSMRSPTSPGTKDSLVQETISTPRSNAMGFISPRSPAVEKFPSNLSAMTHTDASIPFDPRASMAVSMANQHKRKVDDQLCQAQRDASTCPPRGDATPRGGAEALGPAARPQEDISTIEEWLRSNVLQDYAEAIKEYGYDSFQALDEASEEQITEMTQDPDVAMKKPHRHLFLRAWKKRVQVPRG